MTNLTEAAGWVIAGDMTTVFHATDSALLQSVRLAGSVLEGTSQSDMHPRTKQKLLEAMSQGYDKMLEGRKAMLQAHGQMVVIQRRSNLAEVDFGCWGAPQTVFTTAHADQPAPSEKPVTAKA
ncbi:MAG: hypothetical protein ACOY45_04475 [Pseudomonadota bacterium]